MRRYARGGPSSWTGRSLALAAVVATLAVACGGSSSGTGRNASATGSPAGGGSTNSAVAAARTKVASYEQLPTTWPGPTTTVDAKKVSPKKIGVVSCGVTSEACSRMADGIKAAAHALGWTVSTYWNPANLTPDAENAAMVRMIDSGVDGIICVCIPRVVLGQAYAAAKSHHVLIVSTRSESHTFTDPHEVKLGAGEQVAGQMIADWVIADSNGKAKVFMIRDDDFNILKDVSDGFKQEMATCGSCSVVAETNIPTANVFQDVVPKTIDTLRRNPDINYIYSTFDAEGRLAIAGLKQIGEDGKVKIVGGTGGEEASLQLIKNQNPPSFVATTGPPDEWDGWAAVDQALRFWAGAPPVDHPGRPLLIDATNVGKLNAPGYVGTESGLNYQNEYLKLWGLKS